MPSPPLDLGSRTARSPTAGRPALPVALLCPALRPHLTAARASGAERIALALSTPSPPRVGPGRASCVCFTLFHIVSPPVFVSRPFVVSLYRCSLHLFPALPWDSRSPQTLLAAVRPVLASAVGVCQVCDGEVCPLCSPLPGARTGETPGPAARAGGARPCPQARLPAPPPGGRFLPLHTPLGAFSATRLSKLLGTFCARFGIPGRCVCEFPDPQLYL